MFLRIGFKVGLKVSLNPLLSVYFIFCGIGGGRDIVARVIWFVCFVWWLGF